MMATWTFPYKFIHTALFLLSRMPSFIVRILITATQKIINKDHQKGNGKRWPGALEDILLFLLSIFPGPIVWLLITATEKISSSTIPLDSSSSSSSEEEEQEGWSNAHQDILLLIAGRLNFVDQLHFRAVCDTWNSVPNATSCMGKLPWIFGFRVESCGAFRVSGLYDPYTEKTYRIDQQVLKPHTDKEFEAQFVFGSKHGWVFIVLISCDTGECKCILCNAFTMETVHIPDFKIESFSHCTTAKGTFSTIPTCSDCVFYFTTINPEEMVLFTYSYGDETWSTIKLSTCPQMLKILEMVYMNNILYFTCFYGEIWAFDLVHQDWGQIPIDCSVIRKFHECGYIYRLVENDREMLLVGYCLVPPRTYRIYKIDLSRKAWVEQVTGLSNVAIFMDDGCDSSHVVSVTSDYDDEKVKSLGRHIYPYKDYHGLARDFFYLYEMPCDEDEDEKCGYCPLLPDSTGYRIWVRH